MIRTIVAVSIALLLNAGAASAQTTCVPLPNTLTNGSNADASQVMANFNSILSCPRFAPGVAAPTDTEIPTTAGFYTPSDAYNSVMISRGGVANAQTIYFAVNQTSLYSEIQAAHAGILTDTLVLNRQGGNVGIATATPAYVLTVNGTAGGTNAWSSPSDIRLKKDVESISGALDLVRQLRGVRYRWRAVDDREVGKALNLPTEEKQIGFIAQEVEKVVPEAVVRPDGGSSDGVYALKEANLVPVLVEALKEQQQQIDDLKSEIKALKSLKAASASSTSARVQ
jgi:Chaperone of endosialidase